MCKTIELDRHKHVYDYYESLFTCGRRALRSILSWPSRAPSLCLDLHRSGNIQGTFKEHSGNIQGTRREHEGNTKGTRREHEGNTKGTRREHEGNIQ
jgi:hypothetical protein